MTLDKLLDYINLVINKEQKGDSLPGSRFNTALQAVNITLFEREYQRVGETAAEKIKPLYDILMSNRSMKRFISEATLYFNTISYDLPEDYREKLIAVVTSASKSYKCDFVSEEHLERFRFSMLETPKTDEFAAVIRGAYVYVYPTNVSSINLIYLREPSIPVYDWCLGTDTDHEYYMPVNSVIKNNKLELGTTVLQSNVVHWSGATNGYASTSVELDWDNAMHIAFANEILLLMGVNLQDQATYQHAQNERGIK